MAHTILHNNGIYNIWSIDVDAPLFAWGLTRSQLEHYTKTEYGDKGLLDLVQRIERAHEKGSSSLIGDTLEDHIDIYIRLHKGPCDYKSEHFIQEFLTV